MKFVRLSIASGVFFLAMFAARAQILPVAISSGFTDDAVLEGGPDGTAHGDLEGGGADPDVFVTQAYVAENPGVFDPDHPEALLPDDGVITNAANGAIFQLQPYTSLNVAVVNGDLTLTLASPAAYSEISFLLFNRAKRNFAQLSFTLNFTGGSVPLSSSDPVPNWLNGADPTGGEVAATLTSVLEDGAVGIGPEQLDEYDFDVDPSMGLLQSITIHGDSNQLDVLAVSGLDPVEVPEPRIWLMMVAAIAALGLARRRLA